MKRLVTALAMTMFVLPHSAWSQAPQDPNIPATNHFATYLHRDLDTYFAAREGHKVSVSYESLRDGPTITGIAYPKYYLWVEVRLGGKIVDSGAVRVAATDGAKFEVTDFMSRGDILSHPDAVGGIFPAALIPAIRARAGGH